jgi:hypothetical protein
MVVPVSSQQKSRAFAAPGDESTLLKSSFQRLVCGTLGDQALFNGWPSETPSVAEMKQTGRRFSGALYV